MYLLDSEIYEAHGRRWKVERIDDSQEGTMSWDDGDGLGEITKTYCRHEHGSMKKPGQRPLNKPGWNETQFMYDWQSTMKKARKEGWGLSDEELAKFKAKIGREPTKRMIVAESVQRDFDHHRRFIEGDWYYIGVQVTLVEEDEDGEFQDTEFSDSCWRIESDGDYWKEIRDELIASLTSDANERDAAEAQQALDDEAYEMAEAAEVQYWAERDVLTTV